MRKHSLVVLLWLSSTYLQDEDLIKELGALEDRQKALQSEIERNAKRIEEIKTRIRQEHSASAPSGPVITFTLSDAQLFEIPNAEVDPSKWKHIGTIPNRTNHISVLKYSEKRMAYLVKSGAAEGWVLRKCIFENNPVLALKQRDTEIERIEDARVMAEEKAAAAAREKKRVQERVQEQKLRQKRRAEEREKDVMARFGPIVGKRILNREIWIGMTKEMATESWGRPERVNRTVTAGLVHEQWVYGASQYLYFRNGVLTSYQD